MGLSEHVGKTQTTNGLEFILPTKHGHCIDTPVWTKTETPREVPRNWCIHLQRVSLNMPTGSLHNWWYLLTDQEKG